MNKLEKSIDLYGNTVYSKMFQLDSEADFTRAEAYKLKHENKGAVVKTILNSNGKIAMVKATYETA